MRQWARQQVELCFTPTYSSWANPIEAHFGPCASWFRTGSVADEIVRSPADDLFR